jgi:OMF family outer membrane factor
MKFIHLILPVLIGLGAHWNALAQDAVVIQNPDDAFAIVRSRAQISSVHRVQTEIAELTLDASRLNVLNPRLPVNASVVNNTTLPVNFIPAEFFGGPSGTFREITFGQPFITTFNLTPQFEIIHLGKWMEIEVSKQNLNVVQTQQKLDLKLLKEQTSNWFFDAWAWQKKIAYHTLAVAQADSLVQLVKAKNTKGITRDQDLNDAVIYLHQQQALLESSQFGLEENSLIMQSWCDCSFTLAPEIHLRLTETPLVSSTSEIKKAEADLLFASAQLNQSKFDQLPILSFQSSLGWQNNSSDRFVDPNSRWIYSAFIGAKISWDFPTNTQKLTALQSKKLNVDLAESKLKEEQRLAQLKYNRALLISENIHSQVEQLHIIRDLEYQNLKLNELLFLSDQIALDKLMLNQQKWINSELNYQLALIQEYHSILNVNLYAE